MASAVAQQQPGLQPGPLGFACVYQVVFAGDDVPNGTDYSEVTVDFAYTDSPVDMTNKIGAAVRAEARRLNYQVGTNAVITNGFTKV